MTSQEKAQMRQRLESTCNNCAVFSIMSLIVLVIGLLAWLIDSLAGFGLISTNLVLIMVGYPTLLLVCFGAGYGVNKRELEDLNRALAAKVRDLP